MSEESDAPEPPEEELRLDELTLPQRMFVAAVQNPSRGIVILLLFGFAFSFYIAFWLVFPRIAALLTAFTLVVGGIVAAVLYLFR